MTDAKQLSLTKQTSFMKRNKTKCPQFCEVFYALEIGADTL